MTTTTERLFVRTEPREVYKAMLDLIESTHWTTEALACPVYPIKRERVVDMRRGAERNKSGYRMVSFPDTDKPPVKFTYCLVGLLLRVVYPEERKMGGELPDYERYSRPGVPLNEEAFKREVPNSFDLLRGLWDQIPNDYWNPTFGSYRPKMPSQTGMIDTLESWNDGHAEKKDVIALIRRAYDAAAAA